MAEAVKKGAEAVKDKVSESVSGASYEANKAAAKDSNQSVGDRLSSGVDAVKDKIDEKKAEASKESNKSSAENEAKGLVETVKEKAAEAFNYVAGGSEGLVETVKEKATGAYNYVAEKVSEATHAVSGEANKEVAKDSDQPVGTRASAAVDAAKDKVQEKTSEFKAEAHKQSL
jgi:DNA polymerase II small subunit/DNA polymerase delta subunit B